MKTAIYIEDGVVQLVITPESDFEKNALSSFGDKGVEAQIFKGTFYDCRGGWTRQIEVYPSHGFGEPLQGDDSLILRVSDEAKQ